ncbi:MAG: hypothetical protein EAZ24_00405, partial [Burkholderiales bacterium]
MIGTTMRVNRIAFVVVAVSALALGGCSYLPTAFGGSVAKPNLPAAAGAVAVTPAWSVSLGGSQLAALLPAI